MAFENITESDSLHHHLEKMSVLEILQGIHSEDRKLPDILEKAIPQIARLAEAITDKMILGGRLFYIGAGTSGRLGVLDASECPPTFGIPEGKVIGVIAGGEKALVRAVEKAEDDKEQGWKDLLQFQIDQKDIVVGLAASGTTPYVLGALESCKDNAIETGSICCNPDSAISQSARYPIELITGPEFVTGSTRMKAGTAQKLTLNMLSTSVMIRLGRVADNKMVNMQLTNEKLMERGVRMIIEGSNIKDPALARQMLEKHGSVTKVLNFKNSQNF